MHGNVKTKISILYLVVTLCDNFAIRQMTRNHCNIVCSVVTSQTCIHCITTNKSQTTSLTRDRNDTETSHLRYRSGIVYVAQLKILSCRIAQRHRNDEALLVCIEPEGIFTKKKLRGVQWLCIQKYVYKIFYRQIRGLKQINEVCVIK